MAEALLYHPDDATLRALSLGRLAESEFADVSSHLNDCPTCCQRIDQLAAGDYLIARLQQGAADTEAVLVGRAQRRPAVRALRQSKDARPARRNMRSVRFREAQGESSHVVRPSTNAMPQQSETGDRYLLFGEIARGGMGAILRGRDLDLGRDLAVKVLLEKHANQPEMAQRFVEEAQIGGQLQHPGVVPVYDVGQFGDRPFFTMKLVEGMTLAAILREREQPTDDRPRLLNIALQVAQALAYAHSKGVVHRDLKPANIMVGAFGEVQVMDWGLAKVLPEGGIADGEQSRKRERRDDVTTIRTARSSGSTGKFDSQTEAGSILGTPAYMPPEQANGDIAHLDRRADVFGLGAILCEILTGKPPYVGFSNEELHSMAANGELADAHARLDGCGADSALIVLTKWCLSPKAMHRPRDAQGVADGLSEYLNGVQERLQATERERAVAVVRASEESKRRKVQLALAGALVGLLLGGGAFVFWRYEQARVGRERDARNGEAVAGLLSLCEEALRNNDAAKAAVALEAAKKRFAEGGAEAQSDRLARLDTDLALVRDLDAIDQFRWTMGESGLPDPAVVAARTREAVRRFGADPDAAPVDQAAKDVSASVARARVVAALDRLLNDQKSALVRSLLRRVDADAYRDAVRDAVLADDGAKLAELAEQKAVLEQSPQFVAYLGEFAAIPVDRRRQLMRAAVIRRPEDLGLLIMLGHTYSIDQKMADERRWWFQAAVAAAPANAAAHHSLGYALFDKGQVDEAIACYRKAIDLDPKYADAYLNLGAILCDDKRDYAGAIACFQKAIDLDPNDAKSHGNMGNARRAKGEVDEAIACYKKSIDLDPTLAKTHNNLGGVLAVKGQLDQAIACYQKAIELDAKFAGAYLNLGVALKAKGQLDEAIACYQKAIDLEPQFAMAHNAVANALLSKGQLAEAIASYQKAIDLDPKNFVAHTNLGIALAGQGQVDEAIACFQKSIAINPEYARARGQLAKAERLAAMREELAASQNRAYTPATPSECLDLAKWCQVKKLHHTAGRLYAAAFAADPRLAADLKAGHRYSAACQAALAAAGRGEDVAKLDEKERTRLRQQALVWLRADLALWANQLETPQPVDRGALQPALRHWQEDRDMADLRDAAALATLPVEEQMAFTQLWADVAELLKKTEKKPN